VEVDYGILLIGVLPDGKRLLWISGIHGAGTEGASEFLRQNAAEIVRSLPTEPGTGVSRLLRIRYVPADGDREFEIRGIEQLGAAQRAVARSDARRRPGVVFDFGNVVMSFDRTRTYRAIGHVLGIPFEEVQRKIVSSDLRLRYELGEIDDEVFCSEMLKLLNTTTDTLPLEFLKEFWSDIFWRRPEMFEALRSLKDQGVPFVLLSNTNHLHFSRVRKDYPEIVSLFDALILSFEERRMKPDALLYTKAVEELRKRDQSLTVGDVLFIDDREDYVEMANRLGMRGFIYRSYPQFAFWIRAQGLYVP
jgi:HAD superfamily hydrolase (TIGR01509 family)